MSKLFIAVLLLTIIFSCSKKESRVSISENDSLLMILFPSKHGMLKNIPMKASKDSVRSLIPEWKVYHEEPNFLSYENIAVGDKKMEMELTFEEGRLYRQNVQFRKQDLFASDLIKRFNFLYGPFCMDQGYLVWNIKMKSSRDIDLIMKEDKKRIVISFYDYDY